MRNQRYYFDDWIFIIINYTEMQQTWTEIIKATGVIEIRDLPEFALNLRTEVSIHIYKFYITVLKLKD